MVHADVTCDTVVPDAPCVEIALDEVTAPTAEAIAVVLDDVDCVLTVVDTESTVVVVELSEVDSEEISLLKVVDRLKS